MENNNKKQIVVAVSGGMDPLHVGHIRLFQEAKKLGDKLVVILNNDNWLRNKKTQIFMNQNERKEIVQAVDGVDEVVLTSHGSKPKDMSVSKELEKIRPDIFVKGGNQRKDKDVPEVEICKKIGCKMVFDVGDRKSVGEGKSVDLGG